ncbi:type IX secretion system outer membrane channel protein PorV [Flavobacteriales bacterium]|nr:type IX secretion system outer membrane channel protein PorV [Flavobacteriales bacterium]
MKQLKIILAILPFVLCSKYSLAQQNINIDNKFRLNTITTAVPFLIISPDAKAGGMGDVGVASAPDAMSMHWNPAKYAFVKDDIGFSVCYTPWLKALVPDINLSYLTAYKRLNENEVLGFSMRYFSLGEINFTDNNNNPLGSFNPNEFSLDGAYALKLSPNFSTGVALRYVYSNLTGGQQVGTLATKAAHTVAGDFSSFYTKEIRLASQDMIWSTGINISNIGGKVSYTETIDKDFIPANLRIGSSLSTSIDEYNEISFEFDINKLLVPTPPIYNDDSEIISGLDSDVSVISGIIQSFYDAPAGDREVRELIYSMGAEYWYDKQFAIRSGFFYEHPSKGDRQFFTLGAGVRYNVFGLDFSYLIPLQSRDEVNAVNPLSNTLRFALTFDFSALDTEVDN